MFSDSDHKASWESLVEEILDGSLVTLVDYFLAAETLVA